MNLKETDIMVSVAIVTFNHERFIAEALDSILIQKTNFRFELIVGEDLSRDNTRQICIDYKEKHPDKIKLILQKKNVGLRQNNIDVWQACKGKYVALCEGDDYWIDPYKLQKQVDFLENNKGYSACFHQTLIEFDNASDKPNELFAKGLSKNTYLFSDIIERWFTHTTSIVFINFFKDNPTHPIFSSSYFWSDRPLEAFIGKLGNYYYLNETMSVWRQHTSNMTKLGKLDQMNFEGAVAFKKMIKIFPESKTVLSEQVIRWTLLAAENSYQHKKYYKFCMYAISSFANTRSWLGLKNNFKGLRNILLNVKIYQ